MRKILVVDDEKIMLMLTQRILSRKYDVVCAASGAEAIKIFEKEPPDLILSDLMMPEMDGYELHEILQSKSSETVPIIFMTADESDESESKGFEVGAIDYIRKPLKADLLLRRVDKALENLDKIHGLKTAASTDPMTGLLNKSAVQKEIEEIIQKSSGVLLMMDLDSFKLVNDIYGHGMGDKILIRFSELIKHIIRETDLAGRMGGDEFVAYLQHVNDEKILRNKAEYLNAEILKSAKEFMGENFEIPLGVSVGAVFSPEEGNNFETIYKKADNALYQVKQCGKHGLAVYGEVHAAENSLKNDSNLKMILGERNISAGAYFVDFEHFKTIYRLFTRIAEVYQKDISLLEFEKPEKISDEDFKEKILHALRKSDCVTQSSSNKVLILLPETKADDLKIVEDRLNKIFK